MKKEIPLGFEIGTGEPVSIPLHHTIVTGTTQLSGKTTTLEALIERSDTRAIAFRTKRGESGFEVEGDQLHRPFFRERADWQYVQAILEATMRERLKFERSWIIKTTKGATSLLDVFRNVKQELKTAKGLSESVYTNLLAYLEIVVPQIHSIKFATEVRLAKGLNVMDLTAMTAEMQSLVIASTLEWIHKREKNTISVVPEAWKFLPQGRNTPVHQVIESLAREGAAIGNFVFLDSQDITGVDKSVLKNFDVWMLGRQREVNEIVRALKQMPMPANQKPKPEEVAMLQLGNFIVCYESHVKRVYVQPRWLPAALARKIAMGTANREAALPYMPIETDTPKEDPNMIEELQQRIKQLEGELAARSGEHATATASAPAVTFQAGPVNIEAVERQVNIRISMEPRMFATTGVQGRIVYALLKDLDNHPSTEIEIADAMREHGWNYGHGTMAPELSRLVKAGDLMKTDGRPASYRLPGKIELLIDGKPKLTGE